MMANKDKRRIIVENDKEYNRNRKNAQERASEAQREDYVSAVIAASISSEE